MLNAFDVVNIFGGLALNRLLESGAKPAAAAAPQFLSALPAAVIIRRLHDALSGIGASVAVDEKGFKVRRAMALLPSHWSVSSRVLPPLRAPASWQGHDGAGRDRHRCGRLRDRRVAAARGGAARGGMGSQTRLGR